MTKNAREIEARGPNVEQAIASGLSRLGLSREDVIVEVIDEGSRGLLGIGSRNAVVKIRSLKMDVVKDEPVAKPETVVKAAPVAPKPTPKPAPVAKVEKPVVKEEKTAVSPPKSDEIEEIDPDEEREMAVDLMQNLLEKMHVNATVSASLSEPDDLTGRQINIIEVQGDDLGVLIGPRGDTLGSMQYLTRLMVGHKLRNRANFVIDVEGYRRRREQALTRLAERMAQKVLKRGTPVGLEPMPPNERRIIHMALRTNEAVYTQSVGEGNRRKVRILPKE